MRYTDMIGRPVEDLPTPALVVDLDRLEANLAAMAWHAREGGVRFRPHAKHHRPKEKAGSGEPASEICTTRDSRTSIRVRQRRRRVMRFLRHIG